MKNQKLKHLKVVRGIDRQLAIEAKLYDITWMPKSKVHKNKKKDADKYASRRFKKQ